MNSKAEYYERFFFLSRDLLAIAGFDGHFKEVNPAWEKALGFTCKELLEKPYLDFVHPDDRQEAENQMRALMQGQEADKFRTRILSKDGSARWFSWRAIPVPEKQVIFAALLDLTEQMLAEAAGRQAMQRLQLASDSAGIGIWEFNLDKNLLTWDQRMFALYGVHPEDFSGAYEAWEKGLHPDDRAAAAAEFKESVASGKGFHSEFRVLWPDGQIRHIEAHAVCVNDPDGTRRFIGTNWDITERKRSASAMADALNSLVEVKAVLDRTADCIFISRLENLRFIYVNEGARRQVGYSEAELLAMTVVDIKPMFTRERYLEMVRPLLDGARTALTFETLHRHKDGHDIPVEITVQAVRQPGQEPVLVAVARDATARKEAEAARLSRLIQSMSEGIYELDAQGYIVFINDVGARILGYAAQDMIGKNAHGLVHYKRADGSPYPAQDCHILKVFQTGRIFHSENETLFKKDATPIRVRYTSSPIHDAGKIIGAVVTFSDNTERERAADERRKLQAQLAQSQKMESVGRLAGGVAHDFNNILTAITGYSHFLLGSLAPDDKRRSDVEEIKKAGERAAGLTRQLLAFSRQQVLQPKVLDCNALVANLEKMLRRIIGEDVQLVTDLAPVAGRIKADLGQIEQVLLNLVVNAKDAMPKGGKITIRTSKIELKEDYARMHLQLTPGSYVMFEVADTGTGMDSETQSHLFEPFFTTKEQGKGTGLGLATVFGIVKQSGGGIYVYSEPGYGTTFKVYFPQVDEAVRPDGAGPVPARPPVGSETILLVEDDETVRNFVQRALREAGYEVLVARDPGEAIRLCEQRKDPVHLVLTDVIMPQMHGPDLVKRLSPLHPESKVIYMSGYTDTTVAHPGLISSGVPFLQKPLAPDVLARKIREVLDGFL